MQADRGLAGARRALYAHGRVGVGANDVVLVGLDGRHDVAHGAGPGPLDLLQHDPAGLAGSGRRAAELLVLVGGQAPAGEPEPAPPYQVHRVGLAGPVEGAGDRRAPVDHDRVACRVVDVPPADVERRAVRSGLTFFIPYAPRGIVEPAEEQRGVGDITQGLGPVIEVGLEVLDGHAVGAKGGQRKDVLSHQPQVLAGITEMFTFGGENGIGRLGGSGWLGGFGVCPAGRGHA